MDASSVSRPGSVEETMALLDGQGYVADIGLSTAVFLALDLGRPLFVEGDAGVGKTELAKVIAAGLGRELIRLQCYEGLDISAAAYEWNYAAQMIDIRIAEAGGRGDRGGHGDRGGPEDRGGLIDTQALEHDVFSERFLIKRPLLRALEPQGSGPPVLLIDELDRTDAPFEAYLLELLADFQITIPELGTVTAADPPIVVLTSNRTREIHDALKRRCFYYWVDYPDATREREILRRRAPAATEQLRQQVVAFVQALRDQDMFKLPGVAESIDWANALVALDRDELDPETVDRTLGVLLKYQDDIAKVRGERADALVANARGQTAPEPEPKQEPDQAQGRRSGQ